MYKNGIIFREKMMLYMYKRSEDIMIDNFIPTGLYRLEIPIQGDLKKVFFPEGSKVYIKDIKPRYIEGFVNGELVSDFLKDPVFTLRFAVKPLPSEGADLSDQTIRRSLLRKE